MRSKYLIFVFVCLMLASIPATSKMFDLGNYTIDTGAYSVPSDAGVRAGINGSKTLEWSWNDNGNTTIVLLQLSSTPELNNMSDKNYATAFMQAFLVSVISDIDGVTLKTDDFDNYRKNLDVVPVDKPYPGYIAISSRNPTNKLYVGVIDRFDYLVISSNESDLMMGLIMRELKVYPKEESNIARLQAIQKLL